MEYSEARKVQYYLPADLKKIVPNLMLRKDILEKHQAHLERLSHITTVILEGDGSSDSEDPAEQPVSRGMA